MKTHTRRCLSSLAALSLLLLTAGCSDESTSPDLITQEEADDIATQVAASLATDNGGTLAALPLVMDEATSGTKAVETEEVTIGGITYRYSLMFFNAAGDTMVGGYDPLETTRLQMSLQAEGEIQTLRYQARLGHRSLLQVHGVNALADTLVMNGDRSDTLSSDFTALMTEYQRHFRLESHAEIENMRYLKPVESGELPFDGLMTWQMTASRFRDAEQTQLLAQITVMVTVRFDGGETAVIEVEGGWTYRINLRTGAIERA